MKVVAGIVRKPEEKGRKPVNYRRPAGKVAKVKREVEGRVPKTPAPAELRMTVGEAESMVHPHYPRKEVAVITQLVIQLIVAIIVALLTGDGSVGCQF